MKAPKLSGHALRSLSRALAHRRALDSRVLPRPLREQIILHVSSINQCAVCSSIHDKTGRAAGLDDGQVAAARSLTLDGLDPRTQAILRYAELRTLDGESGAPELVAAFERLCTPAEQAEVRAVVDLFTFNNRFNNTWEAILPGARARRRKLGIDHS